MESQAGAGELIREPFDEPASVELVVELLGRVEAKLDAALAELEEFRPLLEAARARLERPRRWGGAARATGGQ